jgi:heat shock protein HslJ
MARFAVSAIALAALMTARCEAAGQATGTGLAGTTWRAETIMGRPVIDSSVPTITFEADGRVHGQGGCNRYFGAAMVAGEQVSFGPVGSTRMACAPALMEQEARFFRALKSAERWSLDEHGLLLINSTGADEPAASRRSRTRAAAAFLSSAASVGVLPGRDRGAGRALDEGDDPGDIGGGAELGDRALPLGMDGDRHRYAEPFGRSRA